MSKDYPKAQTTDSHELVTVTPEGTAAGPLTMSEKAAAARLGAGPDWLAQQARQGDVPFIKLGRTRRYTEEHLAQILAAREQVSADPWARSSRSQARRRRLS